MHSTNHQLDKNVANIEEIDVKTTFSFNPEKMTKPDFLNTLFQDFDYKYAQSFLPSADEFSYKLGIEIFSHLICQGGSQISTRLDKYLLAYIDNYQNCIASCYYTLLLPDMAEKGISEDELHHMVEAKTVTMLQANLERINEYLLLHLSYSTPFKLLLMDCLERQITTLKNGSCFCN